MDAADRKNGGTFGGNMRSCGCQLGRPCTCEIGKVTAASGRPRWLRLGTYACGVCINCRLNAKALRKRAIQKQTECNTGQTKKQKELRRCLQEDAFLADQNYDYLSLHSGCMLRMRKPDWSTHDKSDAYNKLHQLRLAMLEAQASSIATIEKQKQIQIKLNRDLMKAQEMVQKQEEVLRVVSVQQPLIVRRMSRAFEHVDSDVFDTFSKQLVTTESLLPHVKTQLDKVNEIITTEDRNIKIIQDYVYEIAALRLQSSFRIFLRHCRWKTLWECFRQDTQLAAALTIQSLYRMCKAKRRRHFLNVWRQNESQNYAASILQRFFIKTQVIRRLSITQAKQEQMMKAKDRANQNKQAAMHILSRVFERILQRRTLATWKETQCLIRVHEQRKQLCSAVAIQRIFRGYRVRVYLKRLQLLQSLSKRVRTLVDQYIVSGNFWKFILEIDADYRRFIDQQQQEEANAVTFMSTVLKHRKLEEDQLMQDWFTASALQDPIVHGIKQITKSYNSTHHRYSYLDEIESSPSMLKDNSLSQALLESPIVRDIIALSPNKKKADIFPPDLPAKVIRMAMAEGFSLDDTVAVMRGLQAQCKNPEDARVVLKTLKNRTPLMQNPWKSERAMREKSTNPTPKDQCSSSLKPVTLPACTKVCTRPNMKRPRKNRASAEADAFITENLLQSIPGGMNAPIGRLVQVAALKAFDPNADGGDGAFVLPEDGTTDPFQSYLDLESPLLKIRRERQATEAAKPFVQILHENQCFTAYDILYNIRGADEMISWQIPKPLAQRIYDVIGQLHQQSTYISKRYLQHHVRVSVRFEKFFEEWLVRKMTGNQKEGNVGATSPSLQHLPPKEPARGDGDMLDQIRSAIERDVLELPLRGLTLPARDVLFKAAFLTCNSENLREEPLTSSDPYDRFLQSLVSLHTACDTDSMKLLIKQRVELARDVASQYEKQCDELNIEWASDLLVSSMIGTGLGFDPVLAEKVQELLSGVASSAVDLSTKPHLHRTNNVPTSSI